MEKIRIAVCGMGNLGRAVLRNVKSFPDLECVGAFSRRTDKEDVKENGFNVYPFGCIERFSEDVDVLIITMGSRNDLPEITPLLARKFNLVESFDDHEEVKEHFELVDNEARKGKHTALISAGWDPGLFSLMRLYQEAFLPEGNSFTFWGKGVSAGHSEAVKRIPGVLDAVEYTIPNEKSMLLAEKGEIKSLKREEAHRRECFVAIEEKSLENEIERQIKELPHYFKGYETTVHFVSEEELSENHRSFYHGGRVISKDDSSLMDFKVKMESNPDFTSRILLSLARGVYVMKNSGEFGAKTIFDIRPKWTIIKGSDIFKFL